MASAEQYAQWIVANADKKGTPEFETVAKAYQVAKQQAQTPEPSAYEKTAKQATGFVENLQNLAAATGGAMYGTYLGAKQLGAKALDAADDGNRAKSVEKDIAENRDAMAGLTSTKMGVAGDILGNIAVTAPTLMIPGAATVRGATAIGAAQGALRPTLGDESRIGNAAIGGAAGGAGAWVGNKITNALVGQRAATGGSATASSTGGGAGASTTVSGGANVRGTGGGYTFGTVGQDASAGLTQAQRDLVARNPDFRLTPGQASGSKSLQQLEAKLESQPMTSGTFNEIKAQNQELINRRVGEAIGLRNVNQIDSTVLDQAHSRVDRIYDMVRSTKDRAIDPDSFLNGLASVEQNANGMLFTNGKAYSVLDHPLVSQLYRQAQDGTISARQLLDTSSKLGKAARAQMTGASGDRALGQALFEVKDLADDLIAGGLNGRTQRLFDQARNNYRNLMLIESRIGVVNPANGNVSGGTLANVLQQKDKAGYLLGHNTSPMYDAARLAQAFKPVVGDSGTATRSALPGPTDFLLSLPFNVATRAYASAPAVNLAARGGSIAANGLLPSLSPNAVKYLPLAGAGVGLNGGLLALPQ